MAIAIPTLSLAAQLPPDDTNEGLEMTASSLLSSTNNAMDLKATAGSRGDSGNDSTTEPVASTSTSPAGVGNVPMPGGFDIVQHYAELLQKDEHLAMPVAAIESLAQVVARSEASTMTELISELESGASLLRQASFNPVSLSAGADLFLRFVTLQRPSAHQSFNLHKKNLVQRANDFVSDSGKCIEKIVGFATGMIKDDAVILTHSYSRVVTQSLLHAARQRKRFTVYVTEARPFGLGVKTYAILTKAGIPCQVILDSAVAFAMPKVDMVLLGAEALAENGGLINFIGGYQMALAAKYADKPVYALAESFKFVRLFPLNQYDVPRAIPVLQFPENEDVDLNARDSIKIPPTPGRPLVDSPTPEALQMSTSQIQNNPLIDYTTPDLVTLVISDVGILTPSGVSDTLLRVFSG